MRKCCCWFVKLGGRGAPNAVYILNDEREGVCVRCVTCYVMKTSLTKFCILITTRRDYHTQTTGVRKDVGSARRLVVVVVVLPGIPSRPPTTAVLRMYVHGELYRDNRAGGIL